ncbi:DUF4397 domain-containing protein [Haloarchaeobius litoreus]|uniref:DUF4397 domain-containing protein n=1 Tax=Haloarchaeobius litoreus TaxID=755306 RepID=A0ABD6DGH6_9EURY|nr:DUF4397 domain-containing protein [Haloarchaeobius litoreus]
MPDRKLLATVLAIAVIGSTVAFVAAVDSNQLTDEHQASQDQNTSYLRVAHASPDAPAVDVRVDNETVLSNVSFGTVSDYLTMSAGTYNVSILANGTDTAVFDSEVTIEPRTVTTVAASGEVTQSGNTSFAAVFFDDDAFTPGENRSALSVVHLSPDAPAVDVTLANGSVVLAENVTFQNASDYVSVPAGNYTAEIRPATAGNDGTVVTTVNVSLESGQVHSALAVGYLNPDEAPADTPFQVVLTEDASVTVQLPSEDEMMDNETGMDGNETTTDDDAETTTDDDAETTTDGDAETTTDGDETTTEEDDEERVVA